MKVLHVLDISVPKLAGYTTRSYHLVNNQKKLGIHPVVLTSERFGRINEFQEEIDGITYYRTAVNSSFIRKIPLLAELNEIKCLQQRVTAIAIREKVDVIHAHSPSLMAAACIKCCREQNIPLVYEIRAFWEDAAVDRGAFAEGSLKYRLRRSHETRIVKQTTAVIAICEGIKVDLVNRGITEDKIYVVRNGVDYEMFQPLSVNEELKKKYNCQNKIILGFIGSFFNFEGLMDLVAAMKEISAANDKIVLLLVGKGQMDAELRRLTAELGLKDKIIFTGQVPHNEVKEFYSIIDLLVYPRIKKRITDLVTPLKPLEAMAMEKTVLVSDVGGLRELVGADNIAVFFKSGDVRDLAQKCLELCSNESLRIEIGKNARAYILKSWGWNKRAKANKKIYEEIIK